MLVVGDHQTDHHMTQQPMHKGSSSHRRCIPSGRCSERTPLKAARCGPLPTPRDEESVSSLASHFKAHHTRSASHFHYAMTCILLPPEGAACDGIQVLPEGASVVDILGQVGFFAWTWDQSLPGWLTPLDG